MTTALAWITGRICFLAKVQKLLNHGVAKKWCDMEEGCVTAQWRAASVG
ncbi:hypothetical protein SSP24_48370 [Streptomyces spinoverrucosus]|uniref:Uncharacterized protein n=1 Tax=Streptomyces spinoverrucosus TaxID=284043 RepID=A0A4Y3VJF9_9ACTN|nr:hypothetical protein [Streptomyces spinoverrucosus]GEC07182.1 hypothetical protein SSP24_48370 [Streptomyces spinoverrucosus]GHB80913.1 hypothetical protein GCM10010397_59660 [Streptomyces spinoverrucosus]